MEIIFWLNPKTGVIYHKTYNCYITREVGEENQFGHVVLAISSIKNKKLICGNTLHDLKKKLSEEKDTIKTKIIDNIIYKLQKIRER